MFDPRKNYNVTNGLLCSMDPIGRAQLLVHVRGEELAALTGVQKLVVLARSGRLLYGDEVMLDMLCCEAGFTLQEVEDSITREQWEQVPQEFGGSAVS